jgi:hypothetical protein
MILIYAWYTFWHILLAYILHCDEILLYGVDVHGWHMVWAHDVHG